MASIKTFFAGASTCNSIDDENAASVNMATKDVWKCDYCNEAKFESFEAAEKHEESCKIECQLQALYSCKEILQTFTFDADNGLDGDSTTGRVEIIMDVLSKLNNINGVINKQVLQSTSIGRIVGKFAKCNHLPIANKATNIVKDWKDIIASNKYEQDKHLRTTASATTSVTTSVTTSKGTESQPPLKKQRNKVSQLTSATTAPIFCQRGTFSKGTSKTKNEKQIVKSSKQTQTSKPLASIFTKTTHIAKGNCQKAAGDIASATNEKKAIIDCNFINEKDILSEHRKAEYLIQRRQAEEKRKNLQPKSYNSKIANKKVDDRDRNAVEIASIFQRNMGSTGITQQQYKNSIRNSFRTPGKITKLKGSGFSENSPLDLTSITTPSKSDVYFEGMGRITTSEFVPERKSQIKKLLNDFLDTRKCAPCFPIPNHVVNDNTELCLEKEQLDFISCQARKRIWKCPKYQLGIDNVSNCRTMNNNPVPYICSAQDKDDRMYYDSDQYLSSCFASILRPASQQPLQPNDDINMVMIDDITVSGPKQWSDKYKMSCVPNDIYGEDNQNTAEELLSFVNDWKTHRQQAIVAAEIAHQKRKGTKKKKKNLSRKRSYDSDDDFLSDSDDEGGLSKVFVLCGPVGCGKTSLAYAVAKKSNCVVLEINTTDDRGGSSLKKTLEECTQSHSSLALLKRKNNFFADNADLQDTDDEEEQVNNSLAIILIDEVDLLFESDFGFWQSFSNLAQNAKCPIILTATTMPPQLNSSVSFYYRYAHLTKPTPMECASKMCQVAKMESMSWRKGLNHEEIKNGLATIAKMCNCDLRKILHEMQSFNNSKVFVEQNQHKNYYNATHIPMRDTRDEHVDPHIDDHNHATSLEFKKQNNLLRLTEVKKFLNRAERNSDAAILEECLGIYSVPSLAGSVQRCSDIPNDLAFNSTINYDSSSYFGGPDTFMTRPSSRREIQLYSRTSELARKHSSFHPEIIRSSSSISNIAEYGMDFFLHDCITNSISEEEQFLPFPKNSCSEMIPYLIRSSDHNNDGNIRDDLAYDCHLFFYRQERDAICSDALRMIGAVLRDGILPYFNDQMDSSLSLDYIPALRNMAVLERNAAEAFEQLKLMSPNNDDLNLSYSNRRRTRSKQSLEREHYFQSLVCNSTSIDPKDIAEKMANIKLLFKK